MADYLNLFLRWKGEDEEIEGYEAALIMVLWKIARIQAGQANFEDHYRDIAGYAGCAWDCVKFK